MTGATKTTTKTKKHGRLKKSIRKTLGTLFLISAIVVGAIPVDSLEAYTVDGVEVEPIVTDDGSNIPNVSSSERIYCTGDGKFQFAYVTSPGSVSEKVAVILGYSQIGNLAGDTLTIPDTVEVYGKFTYNQGTSNGYVAVNANGRFLYYKVDEPVLDASGNYIYDVVPAVDANGQAILDANGEQTYVEQLRTAPHFYPCDYSKYSVWGGLESSELYYKSNDSVSDNNASGFTQTVNPDEWRLKDAVVAYIGKQHIVKREVASSNDEAGNVIYTEEWLIEDVVNPEDGVFANNGSIMHLNIGENINGIGPYAFYNCSAMQSISFGNGLSTIGNSAFENCYNVKSISLKPNSNLSLIGDHAFYNCNGLQSFDMPVQVSQVGDYAFANCFNLSSVTLDGYPEVGLENVALNKLGRSVFQNCRTLTGLSFPETFTQQVPASVFEGCSELGYIRFRSGQANVVDDGTIFTVEDFKATVPEEFYFEGTDGGAVHSTCKEKSFAFKYLDQDIYEIIVRDDPDGRATFWVNSDNQLIKCEITGVMSEIVIPGTIGPYKVTTIDSGSFQNNCALTRVTIPSSILTIADNAFKGCHNLKNVIFEEPINITSIGSNAFQTQDVTAHSTSCPDSTLANEPELTFTGTISYESAPFQYAMDPSSQINKGTQKVSYIKYYSGWPTNLTVQYNPSTDKNELVDYPIMADLIYYDYNEDGVSSTFPDMTKDNETAAHNAYYKYIRDNGGTGDTSSVGTEAITQDEQAVIDSVLNISIPNGVEAVKPDLFAGKEAQDLEWSKSHWSSLDWVNITADELPVKKSITTNGIAEIADGTFKDCLNLTSVSILGETTKIGDYAFEGCTNLAEATISASVSEMGIRPFKDCPNLIEIDFQGSPYFTCDKAIVYGLANGEKTSIVQCLESKGNGLLSGAYNGKILPEDVAGVDTIYDEAFEDCINVTSVDFSNAEITTIPKRAFANTSRLYSVTLPNSCKSISEQAFYRSGIQSLDIPGSVTYIDPTAFDDVMLSNLTFYCPDNSAATTYAEQKGIEHLPYRGKSTYLVSFYMYDYATNEVKLLKQEDVLDGEDATAPTTTECPELLQDANGWKFTGWNHNGHNITEPTDIYATYVAIDPNAEKFTVEFYDINNQLVESVMVDSGTDATALAPSVAEMAVDGYSFTGWRPAIDNVTENIKTYAQYTALGEAEYVVNFYDYDQTLLHTQTVKAGGSALEPKDPEREGYTFIGWMPAFTNIQKNTDVYAQYERGTDTNGDGVIDDNDSTTGDGTTGDGTTGDGTTGDGTEDGTTNGNANFYTLTVRNGSGSGSYVPGAQVIIIANDPVQGQQFSNWTLDPNDVTIASKAVAATVLTMPEKAVTVTANYAASGTVTGSGNSSTNNSGNKGNSTGGTVVKPNGTEGGTTVVINKNGLSNTGVVSATVNGSSDNFVIKVTEDSSATEAIVKALMNEYGDITNIAYFPMDISLYDETGNTKITDTTGLSISITLPIPDSLITYAGNNKVAGVVNNKLDKLSPKFSTINGVPCVTFTATHFSPYVIYVDTQNLTAGTITDSTPKTGDGIHPKWFLAIGLACISMVLFMKQDKKAVRKVRTVRA